MATGPPPFNNIVYGLYSSPSGSLPEQGNSEVAIPKDEKSPIQSYYHQTGGNLVACGTSGGPGYCQAIGGMGLSAGSDPISEVGRPQRYVNNAYQTSRRATQCQRYWLPFERIATTLPSAILASHVKVPGTTESYLAQKFAFGLVGCRQIYTTDPVD